MKKVRQRKYYECVYEGDDIVDQILRSISVYDTDDHLIEAQSFNADGEVVQYERHTYENGNVVETIQEDIMNEAVRKALHEYDGDRIVSQREYFTDEDYIETTYTYDDQHRVTAVHRQDNDGVSQGYTTTEYADGKTIEKEYDEEDQLVTMQEYVTDENGNKTQTTFTRYMGKEEIITEEEASYQTKDDFAELRRYRGDTLILEAINTFDGQNRIIKTVINDYLNERFSERSFAYDDTGKVIREEYSETGNLLRVNEMQYDEEGELIEETMFLNVHGEYFQTSTNRIEIEYYP